MSNANIAQSKCGVSRLIVGRGAFVEAGRYRCAAAVDTACSIDAYDLMFDFATCNVIMAKCGCSPSTRSICS